MTPTPTQIRSAAFKRISALNLSFSESVKVKRIIDDICTILSVDYVSSVRYQSSLRRSNRLNDELLAIKKEYGKLKLSLRLLRHDIESRNGFELGLDKGD